MEKSEEELSSGFQFVIYSQKINQLGVNTFVENLCFLLDKNGISYKLAGDEVIDCDVCLIVSIFDDLPKNVKYKKIYQIIHTDLEFYGLQPRDRIEHIAVSEHLANKYNCLFIPNFVKRKSVKPYRFLTLSRVDKNKGFEEMAKLQDALIHDKIPFLWHIYGDGSEVYKQKMQEQLKHCSFCGLLDPNYDIFDNYDFLVQLSPQEGFCYSVHEALMHGLPCITQNIEAFDGLDTIKIDLNKIDLSFLNINYEVNYRDKNGQAVQGWWNLI